MPIHINLLAEVQAAEELRRRDPVKRGFWIAGFLVFLVVVWVISQQVEIMRANKSLLGLDTKLNSQAKEFNQILENQKKLIETNRKLGSLQQLATNRFLLGTVLDALQHATLEDVQL